MTDTDTSGTDHLHAKPDLTFESVAVTAAFIGAYIPAHDLTFDLAQNIGRDLDRFLAYVTKVRDAEQAADAVHELLQALTIRAKAAVKE